MLCGLDAGGGGREPEPGARLAARGVGRSLPPGASTAALTSLSGCRRSPRFASKARRLRSIFGASGCWPSSPRIAKPQLVDDEASTAILARDPRCRAARRSRRTRGLARLGRAEPRRRTGRGDRARASTPAGISIGAAGWSGRRCRSRGWRRRGDPAAIRGADGRGTGHATLVKGSPALRRAVPVFEPQPPPLAALSPGSRRGSIPAEFSIPAAWSKGAEPCRPTSRSEQLADPDTAASEKILRTCIHCGFCTATCPTYVLLGDELDSPRGRIYLIKNMLESGEVTAETVKHIDRCLSCLACMTTCPSGVQLHASRRSRPALDRTELPPAVARAGVAAAARHGAVAAAAVPAGAARRGRSPSLSRGFCPSGSRRCWRWRPARSRPPRRWTGRRSFRPKGERRMRVALLPGCAQQVLAPEINEATIRLLTRHGCEVVVARGSGCCGALAHHLGEEAAALGLARANIDAWESERVGGRARRHRRSMPRAAARWSRITGLCCATTRPMPRRRRGSPRSRAMSPRSIADARASNAPSQAVARALRRVAYHSACSMQHGQGIDAEPKALLAAAGFEPLDVPEGHLCCGSAGTYNILQPEIAAALRDRKLANIAATRAGSRRDRQYRLHHAARRRLLRCRSCTRSSCSTGRPAARRRKRCRLAHRRSPARIGGDQRATGKALRGRSVSARSQPASPEHQLSACRAQIDIGDRHRQLADQRAEGVGGERQTGQSEPVIGQGCAA